MKPLWTLVKVVLALALVIPIGFVVLATALGLFGAVMGLAFMALRVALICLVAVGAFKFVTWLFRSPTAPSSAPNEIKELPKPDPYYQAAMRELDRELGDVRS